MTLLPTRARLVPWRWLAVPSLGALAWLAGCAPELDWRDVRPPGTVLQAQLPCKPSAQERQVQLADVRVQLVLMACTAAGQTWGLATADLVDPARVQQALGELAASSAANIGAQVTETVPWQAPGSTPNPAAIRNKLQGRLPDGKAVQMQMAVFAHGTRVFQATVLGERVGEESAQAFFGAVRLAP
jgi:hypothetical protein